jgi:two-component system sensor histidine kinase KdpD
VIARRPEWVLVDELAHTNIPGSEHEKRWQSVEDILGEGINVITTVNIQHLESLNDTVFEVTGVRVKETFPDRILDSADEVVFVDLTPSALINRLKRGVVYDLAKVDQALLGFFTPEKLSALREMALRQTADEVDEKLAAIKPGVAAWCGREVVMVCVTPRPDSIRLVRRGYRLAERLHAELHVVYINDRGRELLGDERQLLDRVWQIARTLGAQVHEQSSDDVAAALVEFIEANGVTFIVLGQSARSRFDEVVRGSIVNRIMREIHGVDVYIMSDRESGELPV